MKTKNSLIFALLSALILLSLISASGFLHISTTAGASNVSSAIISAVESGSTITSSITLGPNPNPIGQNVSVDLRITNGEGIWGWTVPTVTWNPQVLNLTGVQEGPFLADNTADASTFFAGNSKELWDNTNGLIDGGLTEALSAEATSAESSGVLATLTFVVTGIGTSQIGLAGANLRASSSDNVGTNITCNNATIIATLTSITPTPPPSTSPSPSSSTSSTSTASATQTNNPTLSPTQAPEFPAFMLAPIFIFTFLIAFRFCLNRKKATSTNDVKPALDTENQLIPKPENR